MTKIKILLISNMYPSTKSPSFGVFVRDIWSQFSDAKFDKNRVVISRQGGTILSKVLSYTFFGLSSLLRLLFTKQDYIYCHYVSHSLFVPIILKLLGAQFKIIAHVHGSDVILSGKWKIRWLLNNSDVIVVPSTPYKNLLKKNKEYNIVQPIVVYPSGGVPIYYFEIKRKIMLNQRVAFVGRPSPEKRFDRIVSLANKSLDLGLELEFYFYGMSDMYKKVDNLLYYPSMDRKDLALSLNESAFLVITSDRESLCLAGLEAMSLGLVVISSDCVGVSEYIVNGGNGFIVNMEKPGWEQVVFNLLSMDEVSYQRVSSKAVETAYKYKADNVTPKFIRNVFEGEN
jgi:glycosyltransferase involved in cell wall biosynthesis